MKILIRAIANVHGGRIWPAGRRFPTLVADSHGFVRNICGRIKISVTARVPQNTSDGECVLQEVKPPEIQTIRDPHHWPEGPMAIRRTFHLCPSNPFFRRSTKKPRKSLMLTCSILHFIKYFQHFSNTINIVIVLCFLVKLCRNQSQYKIKQQITFTGIFALNRENK